jgi:hypothetical protein
MAWAPTATVVDGIKNSLLTTICKRAAYSKTFFAPESGFLLDSQASTCTDINIPDPRSKFECFHAGKIIGGNKFDCIDAMDLEDYGAQSLTLKPGLEDPPLLPRSFFV